MKMDELLTDFDLLNDSLLSGLLDLPEEGFQSADPTFEVCNYHGQDVPWEAHLTTIEEEITQAPKDQDYTVDDILTEEEMTTALKDLSESFSGEPKEQENAIQLVDAPGFPEFSEETFHYVPLTFEELQDYYNQDYNVDDILTEEEMTTALKDLSESFSGENTESEKDAHQVSGAVGGQGSITTSGTSTDISFPEEGFIYVPPTYTEMLEYHNQTILDEDEDILMTDEEIFEALRQHRLDEEATEVQEPKEYHRCTPASWDAAGLTTNKPFGPEDELTEIVMYNGELFEINPITKPSAVIEAVYRQINPKYTKNQAIMDEPPQWTGFEEPPVPLLRYFQPAPNVMDEPMAWGMEIPQALIP